LLEKCVKSAAAPEKMFLFQPAYLSMLLILYATADAFSPQMTKKFIAYLTGGGDSRIDLASRHHKKGRSGNNRSHAHKSPSRPPADLIAYSSKQLKAGKPVTAGHAEHDKGPFQSVREVDYKDHKITIYTQYKIRVDGKALGGHIYVDNTGKVSAHALPNYSFVSAVDLVKKMIDEFPDDFTTKKKSHRSNSAIRRRRRR
jgi:hypothetical protein